MNPDLPHQTRLRVLLLLALSPLSLGLTGINACQSQDADGDGWTTQEGDCNDADASTHPDALELCDGHDNNCDGTIDEGFPDADGNGTADCPDFDADSDGYFAGEGDCDDGDPGTYPGAQDTPGDGFDQDCGGSDGPQPSVGLDASTYLSIQRAIDAALDGDTVWVGPGTYFEHDIDLKGKAITLQSTGGPDVTVIDARGLGRCMTLVSGEGSDTVVRGFTLANGAETSQVGGGLYLDHVSPTLDLLNIQACKADKGGGFYQDGGAPVFSHCNFNDNTGYYYGGAGTIANGSATFEQCSFARNTTNGNGGALYSQGAISVEDSTFTSNSASQGGGGILANFQPIRVTRSTFLGNIAGSGGAAMITADASSLTDCTFEKNTAVTLYSSGQGGALTLAGTGSSLLRCLLRDNTADNGGGVYIYGNGLGVSDCRFLGNRANINAGGLYCSSQGGAIRNSLFAYNQASGAGGGVYGYPGTVDHCTLVGNRAPYGGGLARSSTSPLSVTNSILADNAGYDLYELSGSWPGTYRYNDFFSRYGASHNLNSIDPSNLQVDPGFVTFLQDGTGARDDLHLAPGSPLIDAGDPATYDPDGSRADLGTYGGPAADMSYYQDVDLDGLYDGWEAAHGLDATTDDRALDPDGDGLSNGQEFTGRTDPQAADTDGDGATDSAELQANSDPLDPYTSPAGTRTVRVPEDFASIQEAVDHLPWTGNIDVAAGTYLEDVLIGDKHIALTGLGGSTQTVIKADQMHAAFTFIGGVLELRGITLTGGKDSVGAGLRMEYGNGLLEDVVVSGNAVGGSSYAKLAGYGGGMYLEHSAPTLNRCTVRNNIASYGGGLVLNQSEPVLTGCTIAGNQAAYTAGGIYMMSSSPRIENCVFSGNSTPGYGSNYYGSQNVPMAVGGAILMDNSSPLLSHCAFEGNWASIYGGAVYLYQGSSPLIQSCTFTGNQAGVSCGAAYVWNSSPTFDHCVMTGNTAPSYGGGIAVTGSSSSVQIRSSILAYNSDYNLYLGSYDGTPTLTVSYTDLYAPPGTHNYYAFLDATDSTGEPGFLSYDSAGMPLELHLATTSALIGHGLGGESDVDGSASDLGAYGGPEGAGWDLDGDELPDYFWPGDWADAPAGIDKSIYDCADRDPSIPLVTSCPD